MKNPFAMVTITSNGSAKNMRDELAALAFKVKELSGRDVLVGVPDSDKNQRTIGEPTEMNNATLAYIHDNGSELAGIPARPFMGPGIKNAKEKLTAEMERVGEVALQKGSSSEDVERGLNRVGLIAQASIRKVIKAGVPPPLAESTLYRRKHRKVAPRQGEKPLVDTSQLLNSINYVVR